MLRLARFRSGTAKDRQDNRQLYYINFREKELTSSFFTIYSPFFGHGQPFHLGSRRSMIGIVAGAISSK